MQAALWWFRGTLHKNINLWLLQLLLKKKNHCLGDFFLMKMGLLKLCLHLAPFGLDEASLVKVIIYTLVGALVYYCCSPFDKQREQKLKFFSYVSVLPDQSDTCHIKSTSAMAFSSFSATNVPMGFFLPGTLR